MKEILAKITDTIRGHIWMIIQGILFTTGFIFGMWGYGLDGSSFQDVFYSTIRLFILELDMDANLPWQMEVARFSAVGFVLIAVVQAVILIIDKKALQPIRLQYMTRDHMVVCGLNEVTVPYLRSEDDDNIVIIEPDPSNSHIAEFEERGMEVLIGDLDNLSMYERAVVSKSRYVLIAAGNDMLNIEIASVLVRYAFENVEALKRNSNQISLIIHLVKKELYSLFDEGGLGAIAAQYLESYKDKPFIKELEGTCESERCKSFERDVLDIRVVSFRQEAAKTLLRQHPVDGDTQAYIESDKPLSLALVGHSELSLSLLEEIFKTAHLPNENPITIYYICEDSLACEEQVNQRFFAWQEAGTFSITFIQSSIEQRTFYALDLWKDASLTNIYLTHEEEQHNIQTAMNLYNQIYFYEARSTEHNHPKILFFMGEDKRFGAFIDQNKINFEQFYSFGKVSQVFTEENLIDQRHEDIAKLVHLAHSNTLNIREMSMSVKENRKAIDDEWRQASMEDQSQSRAQAAHMDLKLKALGLKRVKSDAKDPAALLEQNRKRFDEHLAQRVGKEGCKKIYSDFEQLGRLLEEGSEEECLCYAKSIPLFSSKQGNLFDALTTAEHNRWNMTHWIRGWKHDTKKHKECRLHNCLVPMASLPDSEKATVWYDWASILYIPDYCAVAGYGLEEIALS